MESYHARLMVDQRRSPRVALAHRIEFSRLDDEVSPRHGGIARDISLGGWFIETDIPCGQGDKIVVHLTLPRGQREMELPTIVRYTDKDGMGVQFGLLSARDTHEIAEFVAAEARPSQRPKAH